MGCLAFSPDGTLLATGAVGFGDRPLGNSDLGTRSILHGHSRPVTSLRFSPDCSHPGLLQRRRDRQALGSSLRAVNPSLETAFPRARSINCLAISPDGQLLATFGLKTGLILWDLETGKQIAKLGDREGPVLNLTFSPDGRTLAAGTTSGEIELWDVGSRHRRSALRGHSGSIHGLVFAPDGRTLVSGSDDGTLRIWEETLPRSQLVLVMRSERLTACRAEC